MCLILFGLESHPDFSLVVAANRDEFLNRPTAPVSWWDSSPDVLAGRDLLGGGTWLGVSDTGRLAAVTNVREPGVHDPDAASRGALVAGFLQSSETPQAYSSGIDGGAFNGFNLLTFDQNGGWFCSNRGSSRSGALEVGIHGLSNASLNSPWPKVVEGKEQLRDLIGEIESDRPDPEPFLAMLASQDPAADSKLPSTGVPIEQERALSSRFIRMDRYGTRCSSVIFLRRDGTCFFAERTFPPGGAVEDRRHRFRGSVRDIRNIQIRPGYAQRNR